MIDTDHYIRWQRVDSVARRQRASSAELHGERLSIDVVRADRAADQDQPRRRFRRAPTFAVCVDPLASPADFLVEQDDERVQLITDACTGVAVAGPFPDRGAPQRRVAGDRDRAGLRTAGTGRTRHSTTRSRSAVAAGKRMRSSVWARSRAGTTAKAATSPCGTPMC